MATFDASPCLNARIDDLDIDYIKSSYLPKIFDADTIAEDTRDIREQLASIHLFDRANNCPTYAGIILFGKNPRYFLLGDYVQFVRFAGKDKSGEVLNERIFEGPLYKILPALESFVKIRELVMNACMHRDFQSNMPIRFYQFDDYVEIMNAGGLYGEARPENFPSVNDYRNPLVAEAMKVGKYVNKFNRGVARVQEMLKENGNSRAEFDVSSITAFCVRAYATAEVNLSADNKPSTSQGTSRGTSRGTSQNNITIEEKIIKFCIEPHTLAEIAAYCGFQNKRKFRERYLNPLLGLRIQKTIPDKPTSRFQKYVII